MSASTPGMGRSFVHPWFDALFIGGGLSIVVIPALSAGVWSVVSTSLPMAVLLLVANSAHFASSTVRLYTKPGAFEDWPFLTRALPLLTLVALTVCIAFAGVLGEHLYALALTWSPFHYAAQAFGLSTMYCHRSGYRLTERDTRMLYSCCMLPFLHAFVASSGAGLEWFVSTDWLALGALAELRGTTTLLLKGATFALPAWLLFSLRRERGQAPPWIVVLLVASNGLWWVVFPYVEAFTLATVFHGLQYLAVVVIFHVKDQLALPGNTRGPLAHALRFYALALVLGYALFHVLPLGYVWLGYTWSESALLVIAAINIHHFVVDRYIWRVRRDARNRAVVGS